MRLNTNAKSAVLQLIVLESVLGSIFGLFLFIGFYPLVVFLFDIFLTPPLKNMENYGQFGMVVGLYGLFGVVLGFTCGLIPWVSFKFWLPVFALVNFGFTLLVPDLSIFRLESPPDAAFWFVILVFVLGMFCLDQYACHLVKKEVGWRSISHEEVREQLLSSRSLY